MRPTASEGDGSAAWDVARPQRPCRLAGVDMAAFGVPRSLVDGLRVVPHPAVMLILLFGPSEAAVDDGSGRRQCGSLVAGSGFGSGGAVRAWGEQVECVQVRLSPVIAGAVLGAGPDELAGGVVSLDDLWGREAAGVRERLEEAPTWQERFAVTEAVLARRLGAPPRVDREVAWAWRRILAGRGLVRVEDLASEVGWSRKRLWSRFRAQVGMPPKSAARLVRFDHAVHRLVAGEGPARVAAESGYFDQPHLHRDVMEFAGVTPAAVAGEPFLTVDGLAWPGSAHPAQRAAIGGPGR
ncbi:helix-turn-helix domain-containing protein [Streptomyces sp. NPDC020917]|uniref:helix-turn-helix domain-containing protein n=1 Tax=Streptomyces sp. NPDC020917 TaxID=3365102 RepID=UPI0037AA41F0